jgi:aspartate/methionine/tyrosine aminotransferase
MNKIARRMADIQPFHVMEILKRAHQLEAAGRDIIHLEVGEPDFPTRPPSSKRPAISWLAATCITRRRSASPRCAKRSHASTTTASVPTSPRTHHRDAGRFGRADAGPRRHHRSGRRMAAARPRLPSNRHLVRSFEGVARALPVDATTRFQPTPAHVADAWTARTRGLMVASPANPTGTLLSQDEIIALHEAVGPRRHPDRGRDLPGLNYGVDASTALSRLDDVFVVNSFSKYFGMTGWRLGWMVAPQAYVRQIEKLAQHFFISPSTPAQHAALAAFTPATLEILEERRHAFAARRNTLLPALRELGFRFATEPQGAFYLYADISDLADSSETLARRLIEDAGVATTPGIDFGDNAPDRHLRIAYTTGEARLVEAAERIARVLRTG